MVIPKIHTWLTKQFEIVQQSENISEVKRIKDGIIFDLDNLIEFNGNLFQPIKFYDDLKNVDITNVYQKEELKIEINQLEIFEPSGDIDDEIEIFKNEEELVPVPEDYSGIADFVNQTIIEEIAKLRKKKK